MSNRDISRRAFLQGGLIAGVGVTLAPLGSQAFAALFENQVTVSAQRWMAGNGQVRFRNDALSKVCGNKVFARDIRARDMPGWPAAARPRHVARRPFAPTASTKATTFPGWAPNCSRTVSSPPPTWRRTASSSPRRIRPIRSCRRARCRCSSAIRWRS
ncbi:twin-arginine translocation signal domain-containing protein [Pseudomonas aeruginosa]